MRYFKKEKEEEKDKEIDKEIKENKQNKKQKIIKIIINGIILVIFAIIIIYSLPILKEILTKQGRQEFIKSVENRPYIAYLILAFLQVAQIFLFFIPGEPIEILAGTLFGTINGTLFILISSSIIYFLIFLFVKKYGKKALYYLASKKMKPKLEKLSNSKIFNNKRYIEYVLIIIYLMPGTPKDLIALVAGFFPIKSLNYLIIVVFARIPSIISSTIIGSNVIEGNFVYGILYYLIIFLICFILIFISFKLDKKNIAKNALKQIEKINKEE